MRYDNIVEGRFLDRPNRFIAHVEVDGKVVITHVKNTGRCKEILLPGVSVILDDQRGKNRKTDFDLVSAYKEGIGLINIDSQAPNKIVKEWLQTLDYDLIKPEYVYGDSRVDFYMEKDGKRILMEVKGCTLEYDGIGYFPDAPTERGVKHLRELRKAVSEGYEAYLTFVIQMNGIEEVRPQKEIHPEFGEALQEAMDAGVRVWFLCCEVTKQEVKWVKCVPKS